MRGDSTADRKVSGTSISDYKVEKDTFTFTLKAGDQELKQTITIT